MQRLPAGLASGLRIASSARKALPLAPFSGGGGSASSSARGRVFTQQYQRHFSVGLEDPSKGTRSTAGVTVVMGRHDLIRDRKMHGGFADRYAVPEGGELGEGGYGNVFTAVDKVTGIKRAAKRIPKSRLTDDPGMFENEVNSMLKLDHPHVLNLIEWFDEVEDFLLILELCTGPNLFDTIMKRGMTTAWCRGKFGEAETAKLMRQMLQAILCCHSHGIIHRDIKPENFIFDRPGSNSNLKLIDLGLSVQHTDGEKIDQDQDRLIGTMAYMAPELLQGLPYDRKCDMWSLGVIMWPLLVGDLLFPIESHVLYKDYVKMIGGPVYVKMRLRRIKDTVSADAHDLLSRMLQTDPMARISAKDALLHPFFQREDRARSIITLPHWYSASEQRSVPFASCA